MLNVDDQKDLQFQAETKEFKSFDFVVPNGIEIRKNAFGTCLYATKRFNKGDLIYVMKTLVIDKPGPDDSNLILRTQHGEYLIDKTKHLVTLIDGRKRFFYIDSFMNHSCDPNLYCTEFKDKDSYENIALRDIEPGEEITCDYDLHGYDARDKGIDPCLCGTSKCNGFSHGFKYLKPELKEIMFIYAYQEIKERYLKDLEFEK